jgi:cytochrome c oxidase subunit 2
VNELFRHLLVLPEQASTIARDIDTLHYIVISISVLGAVGVAAAVALLLLKYRRAAGTPRQRQQPLSVAIELVGLAGLLGMFVVFWAIGFRQFVRLQSPPEDSIDVYVVAKQWMWAFAYADGSATTDELYVPAGRPIRLIMTWRDVFPSF